MKTILVPTDFSLNATKALSYAVELAKKEGAKIILLHAFSISSIDTYLPYDAVTEEQTIAKKQSDERLKSLAMKIVHPNKIKCEYITKEDTAVEAILKLADERNVDLIVMGTKGAGGIKKIILGSNAASVIEKAKCPVIAVPEKATTREIKHITFATDYHKSDFDSLNKLLEIAEPFDAQINLLHVSPNENEGQNQLMRMFMNEISKNVKYYNISYQIVSGTDVLKKLEEYLEMEQPDLFVMSTHQRDLQDKLFNKSITRKLAYQTKTPLMAFHYKKEKSFNG